MKKNDKFYLINIKFESNILKIYKNIVFYRESGKNNYLKEVVTTTPSLDEVTQTQYDV